MEKKYIEEKHQERLEKYKELVIRHNNAIVDMFETFKNNDIKYASPFDDIYEEYKKSKFIYDLVIKLAMAECYVHVKMKYENSDRYRLCNKKIVYINPYTAKPSKRSIDALTNAIRGLIIAIGNIYLSMAEIEKRRNYTKLKNG